MKLLEQLGAEAAARADWAEYGAYVAARLRGLRGPALERMTGFVATTDAWTEPARREFTAWLCEHLARHDDVPHDATPQPLVTGLLLPTLFRWIEHEPADARPHRWLGLLFRNVHVHGDFPVNAYRHLRRAVELDPAEPSARVALVAWLLDHAANDTHLLPDRFFGDAAQTLATLDEAASVVRGVAANEQRAALEHEVAVMRRMVRDWIEFTEEDGDDFAAWCDARGRTYAWTRNYHYER